MDFLFEFLQVFCSFLAFPFVALFMILSEIVSDPWTRGMTVCIIGSILYFALCYGVSRVGWKCEDSIAHNQHVHLWSRGEGWCALNLFLKLILWAAHLSLYMVVWEGKACGLSKTDHSVVVIVGFIITMVVPALTGYLVEAANEKDMWNPSGYCS